MAKTLEDGQGEVSDGQDETQEGPDEAHDGHFFTGQKSILLDVKKKPLNGLRMKR